MLHTCNNTDGNKLVIFSGIASYYGDNDFTIQTFNFIAHSNPVSACDLESIIMTSSVRMTEMFE